ncbi:MAG: hypothetical protein ABWZ53_09845 [Actinomycetota bacterium]
MELLQGDREDLAEVTGDDRSSRRWRLASLGAGTLVAAVVAIVLYTARFAGVPEPAAVGFDTPLYQYRANLIAEAGTGALEGWTPSYVHDQDRATTATLWALLGSVTGREPSSLALLWPAAMGVAVGAGAAAFARSVWREPGWAAPIYLVAVGASVQVARTAGGSLDNLTVDPVVLVAAAAALVATTETTEGNRTLAGAVALVAAAVPIHWVLATVIAALLLLVGMLLIPDAVRRSRAGAPWRELPAVRLAATATVGQGLGWGLLIAVAGVPPRGPSLRLEKVLEKDAARSSSGPVWATGAAAIAGAARLGRERTPARWGMWFMLLWAATVPLAATALHILDLTVPSYRVVDFALAIPVLAAAAVVWLVRGIHRSIAGPRDRRNEGAASGTSTVATPFVAGAIAAGAFVAVAALSLGAWWAGDLWRSQEPAVPGGAAQAATAAAYMDAAVPEGPVVFLTTFLNPRLPDRVVRAAMPATAVTRPLMAVGKPEDLAEGRQTTGGGRIAEASALTWSAAGPAIASGAPVLQLAAFTPGTDALSGSRPLGPGVVLVQGPEPPASFHAAAPAARPLWDLVIEVAALLALIGVSGLGWAWSLGPGDRASRVLASIPFGVAVLAVGAVVADALGMTFSRVSATGLVAGIALLGGALALLTSLSRPQRA